MKRAHFSVLEIDVYRKYSSPLLCAILEIFKYAISTTLSLHSTISVFSKHCVIRASRTPGDWFLKTLNHCFSKSYFSIFWLWTDIKWSEDSKRSHSISFIMYYDIRVVTQYGQNEPFSYGWTNIRKTVKNIRSAHLSLVL